MCMHGERRTEIISSWSLSLGHGHGAFAALLSVPVKSWTTREICTCSCFCQKLRSLVCLVWARCLSVIIFALFFKPIPREQPRAFDFKLKVYGFLSFSFYLVLFSRLFPLCSMVSSSEC
ncbi:hypothetical protein V8F06_012066 [Rhypophila decipiens]